jgi:hypothetical protein
MHYSEDLEVYSLNTLLNILWLAPLKKSLVIIAPDFTISPFNSQPHLQNGCGIVSFAFPF